MMEEEAGGKTQFCVDGKLVLFHCLADLLTLIVCYSSAASEPSLLSATWIFPAVLLGLSSVHVFTWTWAVSFPCY